MKFILIRHGETYAKALCHTEDCLLIGALDTEITHLNETGIQQAQQAKIQLANTKIDAIYCSDLVRAKQTASIIFENRDVIYTPLLRERSLGSDQGKRSTDVFLQPDAYQYHVNTEEDCLEDCLHKKVFDGECYNEVFQRLQQFLSTFDFHEKKTIAIVSHFHTLRCLTYLLWNKQPDKELFTLMIENAKPIIYEKQAS